MPGLYSLIVTEADGNTITAAKRNAEHTNHITNQTPQMTDDYSSNAAQMQTQTDPGESGTESLPTSLSGELDRLRFAIAELKGKSYWYESAGNLAFGAHGNVTNLGLTLAAGVLTVTQASGSALSTTNIGRVCMSSATGGLTVSLLVTAPATINDDVHASSDFTNTEFGVPSGANWATDMPFYLYVANKSNANVTSVDGGSVFFLARSPEMTTTPSSANSIGDTDAGPTTDDCNAIMVLAAITQANYVSLPCQVVGAIRMQYATATHDWTIQTLGSKDGFGIDKVRRMRETIRVATSDGTNPGVGGLVRATSSGNYSNSSGTEVTVTNQTVTLTTSGRPVYLGLEADGTTSQSYVGIESNDWDASEEAYLFFYRDSTLVSKTAIHWTIATTAYGGSMYVPIGSVHCIDPSPAAGTYSYSFKIQTPETLYVYYCRLLAYEL